MTTAEFTERVHRMLARVSPDEVTAFEAELQAALETSRGNHGDSDVRRVVLQWAGRAALQADPLTDDELAAIDRARAGDSRGLHVLDSDGSWRTL